MASIGSTESAATVRAKLNKLLSLGVNAQTGTSYTLVVSDESKLVTLDNSSTVTVIVTPGLGASFTCALSQVGTGAVSVVGSGGAVVRAYNNQLGLSGRYAVVELLSYADNSYLLTEDTKFVGGSGGGGGGGVSGLYTSWDAATKSSGVALSNNNLTVSRTDNLSNNGARSVDYKSTGKRYFEILVNSIGGGDCIGVAIAAATYNDIVNVATNGAYVYSSGEIWTNGGDTTLDIGSITAGMIIGVASDGDNDKVWLRKASPLEDWNGQAIGSQNPVGNVGGISLSALSGAAVAPAVGFHSTATGNFTANFGDSVFSGSVPSGFTAGWPIL